MKFIFFLYLIVEYISHQVGGNLLDNRGEVLVNSLVGLGHQRVPDRRHRSLHAMKTFKIWPKTIKLSRYCKLPKDEQKTWPKVDVWCISQSNGTFTYDIRRGCVNFVMKISCQMRTRGEDGVQKSDNFADVKNVPQRNS